MTPFQIQIPDAALADLHARLDATRLPAPLPGDGWESGVPVSVLRDHVERWRRHDWRATESRLNALPQFTSRIDGQTIHVVHVRSNTPDALPVLLTHGWPGSFLEFEGLIGPLTADGFDVVIPSLPGFGFSTPLSDSAWPTSRIARAWVTLMDRLGYERFAVQGGDIGGAVSPEVARVAPERVVGVHVNGALGGFAGEPADDMSPIELNRVRRVGEFMRDEAGYIAIQSTRPGLIGALTADSPAAQLAWMLDKLQAWSHPAAAPATDVLGDEFVFANASLYWFTASGGSAASVGYANAGGWNDVPANSGVPTAAIQFAHDVGLRRVAEASNTVVRWTDVDDRGGHFAALEEPEILVRDLRLFLRSL